MTLFVLIVTNASTIDMVLASNYTCVSVSKYLNESTIFNAAQNGTLLGFKLHYVNGYVLTNWDVNWIQLKLKYF